MIGKNKVETFEITKQQHNAKPHKEKKRKVVTAEGKDVSRIFANLLPETLLYPPL